MTMIESLLQRNSSPYMYIEENK